MSNLSGRKVIGPGWIEAVQPTLDGFINCTIDLIDMQTDETTDYNWKTNSGGTTSTTILYSGEAQFQVYRFTLTMDAPVGSVDQVRNGRFTVKRDLIGDIDIRKGMQIRITACDDNPSLMTYQYVVNSGLNAGTPLRRTIETEIDMARVVS